MLDTLNDVHSEVCEHHRQAVAQILLWDWRTAGQIAEEAWQRLQAKRDVIEAAAAKYQSREDQSGVIRGAITDAYQSPAIDLAIALGYLPPDCEIGIAALELSDEQAAAVRAERAELAQRIETLPITLREPMRLWLDDEEIPESLGWYVRQGLTLLGQRRAAA